MDTKSEKILKQNSISLTKPREDILEEIKKLHHFSYIDLEKKLKDIGRASIFRTLKLFTKIGIIKIVDNRDGAIIYELDDDTNHHEHMKCRKCGKIIEFDDSQLHQLFEKIAKKNNFILEGHSVLFEGICDTCR